MQHKESAVIHQYFQQKSINPFSDSLEKPVKELMDLNIKALQSFSYLTPSELLTMRRPEEMMEKNLEVFIENSHHALNYMHNMFDLMEKHLLQNFDNTIKNTRDLSQAMKTTASATAPSRESTRSSAAKSTRTTGATAKAKTKKPVASQSATSSKKQPVKHTSASTNKPSMNSAAKSHNATPEVKHPSTPHSTSSASSHPKPTTHEVDSHKKG
jgi:hypothetical protein